MVEGFVQDKLGGDKRIDWFHQIVRRKVGSSGNTRFWHDAWIGVTPLREMFPRLYSLLEQREDLVVDMGEWVEGVCCLGKMFVREREI